MLGYPNSYASQHARRPSTQLAGGIGQFISSLHPSHAMHKGIRWLNSHPLSHKGKCSCLWGKKLSMAISLPVENLLPQNVGLIINYLQYYTEVAQWGIPSCSRPQPVTDNGVRDGRSNWLVALPPTSAVFILVICAYVHVNVYDPSSMHACCFCIFVLLHSLRSHAKCLGQHSCMSHISYNE